MIEIKDLCIHFGPKEVLNNVNFTIEEGDFVIITGKSGCGKTTLINCIAMLEKFSSGDIIYKGLSYKKSRNSQRMKVLKKDFGIIFQSFELIEELSVYKNLEFVNRNKTRIREKLEEFKLDIDLKTKTSLLSGGEKQRLALVRVALKESKVIFADEPTGNLDDENAKVIMDYLKCLNDQGKTIIVVTHDLTFRDYGTKFLEL